MNVQVQHNKEHIIPLKGTYELWKNKFIQFPIIYLEALSGYGKTVNAIEFAKDNYKEWEYITCKSKRFTHELSSIMGMEFDKRCKTLIIIDDLELLYDKNDRDKVFSFILEITKTNNRISFLILSRAGLPKYLEPFFYTRNLEIRYKEDLTFNKIEIEEAFQLNKLELISEEIENCYKITNGYPIATLLYINCIARGEKDNENIKALIETGVFKYMDLEVFTHLDKRVQKFLVQMARFEEFDIEIIQEVACNDNGKEMIDMILEQDGYLSVIKNRNYVIDKYFRNFLLVKEEDIFTEEQRRIFYYRVAIYYEKNNNLMEALKYYSMAKDYDKVVEILIYNLDSYGGSSNFKETYTFYYSLPEETVLQSPELLSAMAMLCSVMMNEEKSKYYLNKLDELINSIDKNDYRLNKAIEKRAYLNIAIPHSGIIDIMKKIVDTAKCCISNGISLKMVSVTGNLPSLMNGGKDFCQWSKHDKLLHKLMSKPIRQALGRNADGLRDIALGESLYEKDKRFEAISYLTKGLSEATLGGQFQNEYAAIGVMSRLFLADGNLDTAESIVSNLLNKMESINHKEFTLNIKANIISLEFRKGNDKSIKEWLKDNAPDEFSEFFITDRYQFMIKIRAYIYMEKYMEALSLIERMSIYTTKYKRIYLDMELGLLKAVILYRLGREYTDIFLSTLKIAENYNFIRVIADEGMLLYPLWKDINFDRLDIKFKVDYIKAVEKALKIQADLYPKYLQPLVNPESLSKYELEVIRLLAEGLNNEEIANTLSVSRATVKYHVSNMYKKLKVNNRTMAVKVANERKIL